MKYSIGYAGKVSRNMPVPELAPITGFVLELFNRKS